MTAHAGGEALALSGEVWQGGMHCAIVEGKDEKEVRGMALLQNSASSWHGHVYGQAMPVLSTCSI